MNFTHSLNRLHRGTIGGRLLEDRIVPAHIVFQNGINGYSGTHDTELNEASPSMPLGSAAAIGEVQTSGAHRQSLLRFDDMFGTGPRQIPSGSTITSATLHWYVSKRATGADTVSLSRMLVSWGDASTTWNSLVNGVARDGVEAAGTADANVTNAGALSDVFVGGLASALQAWSNGASNNGWLIENSSVTSAYEVLSAEAVGLYVRPALSVDYTPPVLPQSIAFLDAEVTVDERAGAATISVVRSQTTSATTVGYTTLAGTASSGDFTAVTGTLSFAVGQSKATFEVPITMDLVSEGPETVTLQLNQFQNGWQAGYQNSAVLTISDLVINEVNVNPPGVDNPWEFVELRGTPGASCAGLYLAVIEGDGDATLGTADLVVPLNSAVIGSNGLLVVKSPTQGHSVGAGAGLFGDPSFDNSGGVIENGSNSILLISSPTSTVDQGIDYDLDNDGSLDNLPFDAVIVDSIGFSDGDNSKTANKLDRLYSDVVLFANAAVEPGAASRFRGDMRLQRRESWFAGSLSGVNSSLTYDGATLSIGAPANAMLTPGADNTGPSAVRVANVVVNDGSIQRSIVTKLTVVFDAVVTLGSSAFALTRTGPTAGTVSLNVAVNTGGSPAVTSAVITFTGGAIDGTSLADGQFRLTLDHSQVFDTEGQGLDGNGDGIGGDDFATPAAPNAGYLYRLFGDANGDRKVDAIDFGAFRAAFNSVGPNPPFNAAFDSNGDQKIDAVDFGAFRSRFNTAFP